jgi:ribosome modulation factor
MVKGDFEMRLIDFAKRRPDGLIDQNWVEGFEAYKLQKPPEFCPYDDASEEFNAWIEGWMEAGYSRNVVQDVHDFQFAGQEPGCAPA